MPHIGTLDVDICLHAEASGDGEYNQPVEFIPALQTMKGYAIANRLKQKDAFGQVDAWVSVPGMR